MSATGPAVAGAAAVVVCDSCDGEIAPGAVANCGTCTADAIGCAEAELEADHEGETVKAADEIREWAARRFLMGQISAAVRAELELCADDIEVGHG